MSTKSRILLVEDSVDFQNLVAKTLGNAFFLTNASTLAEAREQLKTHDYDLILLDVVLPDGDGFAFCASLQNDEKVKYIPIIFLTSKDASEDKVTGFSLGAEDYVVKPYDPAEFRARVEAKIRRKSVDRDIGNLLKRGLLHIEIPFQRVYIEDQEQRRDLGLTPIEFKLLLCLARSQDQVLKRDQLLSYVWGENVHVMDRSIDAHISSLRKKLGPSAQFIRSVYGSGYVFSMKKAS